MPRLPTTDSFIRAVLASVIGSTKKKIIATTTRLLSRYMDDPSVHATMEGGGNRVCVRDHAMAISAVGLARTDRLKQGRGRIADGSCSQPKLAAPKIPAILRS